MPSMASAATMVPSTGLTATLVAYVVGDAVSARCRRHPLANPVVIAAGLLIILLAVTGTPYPAYFEGAQFVHFLLGPATVALAVVTGFLVGRGGGTAGSDWAGLAIGLLVVVVGAAGFEFGRRSAAPVVMLDAALLARLTRGDDR